MRGLALYVAIVVALATSPSAFAFGFIFAGLMSALGMGLASVGRVVTRGVYQPFADQSRKMIRQIADELKTSATERRL